MKILTVDDLAQEGISISDVQKSLTMTYSTKNFRRKSDLPKKFKEKALSICAEIGNLGKESFVIETNYSYTVWEEEKSVNSEVKKIETNSSNSLIENKEHNSDIPTSLTSVMDRNISSNSQIKVNSPPQEKTTATENVAVNSGKREYNLFQYTSDNDSLDNIRERQNQRLSYVEETSTEVVKYRGFVINDSVKEATTTPLGNQSSAIKRKPRTYRGVTY